MFIMSSNSGIQIPSIYYFLSLYFLSSLYPCHYYSIQNYSLLFTYETSVNIKTWIIVIIISESRSIVVVYELPACQKFTFLCILGVTNMTILPLAFYSTFSSECNNVYLLFSMMVPYLILFTSLHQIPITDNEKLSCIFVTSPSIPFLSS